MASPASRRYFTRPARIINDWGAHEYSGSWQHAYDSAGLPEPAQTAGGAVFPLRATEAGQRFGAACANRFANCPAFATPFGEAAVLSGQARHAAEQGDRPRSDAARRAVIGANTLCAIVSVIGVSVVIGWLFDFPALRNIYPGWVSMKFSTAFSFMLAGTMVYCVGRIARGDRAWAQVLLPVLVLMILLPMAALLTANVLGIDIAVADMIVQEGDSAVKTVSPGRPSFMTMVSFILIAQVGLVAMFVPQGKPTLWRLAGTALLVIGVIALLGYLLDAPALYYYRANFSTAMAAHTAMLFILLGASLWLTAQEADKAGP